MAGGGTEVHGVGLGGGAAGVGPAFAVQGGGHEAPPTFSDVLYSLVSDAQCVHGETFEGFCSNLGYDSDSRKALATFEACRDGRERLIAFLGDDVYLQLLRSDEDEVYAWGASVPTYRHRHLAPWGDFARRHGLPNPY